jgi:hypothetical protein
MRAWGVFFCYHELPVAFRKRSCLWEPTSNNMKTSKTLYPNPPKVAAGGGVTGGKSNLRKRLGWQSNSRGNAYSSRNPELEEQAYSCNYSYRYFP